MKDRASELGAADRVLCVEGNDDFNPEAYASAALKVIQAESPDLVLVGSTSMGMDIAPVLGVSMDLPVISYCSGIENAGDGYEFTSQLYGGKMDVKSSASKAVAMVLAGSFSADDGKSGGSAIVEDVSVGAGSSRVQFKELIEPEAADVDITQSDILVAVGRGIGSKDDIEVAQELAETLNADLACSRPVVDAGWLPKSCQVGKSGLKVNPKVYIALGISGAPEHLEGMKDVSTIIAVNTDKNAPIFDVAHYGMTDDLFDICEEIGDSL
jgi:electron transfer flavoprotein alpha subunit